MVELHGGYTEVETMVVAVVVVVVMQLLVVVKVVQVAWVMVVVEGEAAGSEEAQRSAPKHSWAEVDDCHALRLPAILDNALNPHKTLLIHPSLFLSAITATFATFTTYTIMRL
ncbi:hypothetical protein E2C01_094351 [Portunus trituberculatus]|uniref:Uncharacterized protein n=1 Tax=Portunus trituberculatus TaxID=210409 RepID=A0A5B7JQ69_PORTR|nr:hypothetical protein [Portunus trituberculatus]